MKTIKAYAIVDKDQIPIDNHLIADAQKYAGAQVHNVNAVIGAYRCCALLANEAQNETKYRKAVSSFKHWESLLQRFVVLKGTRPIKEGEHEVS